MKPTDSAIKRYHELLQSFRDQRVTHEGAVETAFQQLLAAAAKRHGCILVPKQKYQAGNATLYPDGTVREPLFDTRLGFWEAKDTDDDLDREISAKIAKGYPLRNTVFEDTGRAVLYQGGHERARFDLSRPQHVADLLNEFFAWHEPEIEDFHQAVEEFKSRVPELAKKLVGKLDEAHRTNRTFQAAFATFFDLCRDTLNPNLSRAAVDEMLVQHLLTERLIRKIFDNPGFMKRNAIAVEIERVIDALTSLTFRRDEFLKSLDRFYRAIEEAARTLEDFAEKQRFLNTVYERFFQGYSVKTADTHGIVYTPQEIVDFMCASVEHVLQAEFGLGLGSTDVRILDPCTGTGNFVVNLLNRVPKRDLGKVYRERLFANEVMLLPYYVAALNIEHAYYVRTGRYEPFPGLCFADTLDMVDEKDASLFAAENTARILREQDAPITVIVGNPPYNAWQLNENDNNKNRKYPQVEKRVRETYARDSAASNKNALSDPYVKFFRWAVDRLGDRDGIVCFVSNNSFVEQIAFDGMRRHLLQDFTRIHHVHLEGNVRQNPTLSGTAYNVFGIQVGVGITVAVRHGRHRDRRIYFRRVEKTLRREEKLRLLAEMGSIAAPGWQRLAPDPSATWLVPANADEFRRHLPIGNREAKDGDDEAEATVFRLFSNGVKTNRDDVAYDWDETVLAERVRTFVDDYNGEVDRYRRSGGEQSVDDFVRRERIKWSESLKSNLVRGRYAEFRADRLRTAMFRPFCRKHLYFDEILNERRYQFPCLLPRRSAADENRIIVVSDVGHRAKTFSTLMADGIVDLHLCASLDGHQCFPFYVYDEDGGNRRENVTNWALRAFRDHYGARRLGKWDVFHYVYAMLHHPAYRAKFADSLRRELPRIPFAPDFKAFAAAGKRLADLHVGYESAEEYPLKWVEADGVPLSLRVADKMRLSKDRTSLRVNPSLTLAGIPRETFEYVLGNRSALEWIVDQYQVKEDTDRGWRSDPNRPDDEGYIVRLVGQVVRVSLETMKIVKSLPAEFSDA